MSRGVPGAIADVLAEGAARVPRRLALAGEVALNWIALEREARAAAKRHGMTARSGSRVILPMRNTVTDVVSYLGLVLAGVTVLPVDARTTAPERAELAALFGVGGPTRDGRAGRLALATSGVTGRPKLIDRTWLAAIENSRAFGAAASFEPDDRMVLTTPVHHSYAVSLLLAAWAHQAGVILCPLPFRAAAITASARKYHATLMQSVPYLYRLMLRSLTAGITPPVRTYITAGDVLPQDVADQWRARTGAALHDHYGASEVGAITYNAVGTPRSAGRAIAGVTLRIEGSASDGRVHVRVRGARTRYCVGGRPRPVLGEGFFATGDLGHITAGELFLTGRLSQRLNVAGAKVDPVEIERALEQIPGVAEAAVVGRHARDDTDEVWAFVSGSALSTGDLRRQLAGSLSPHKLPSRLVTLERIPRTGSGKVRRGALLDLADSLASGSADGSRA